MSKELEALDKLIKEYLHLCGKLSTNQQEKMLLDSNSPYNILKQYLEQIDNTKPNEVLEEMNEDELFKFLQANDGLFGWYCKIPFGFGTPEEHIYKIVGCFGKSNSWSDIPHTYLNEIPKLHDTMEYVVNVIHCGLDETKVLRFALKDIKPFKKGGAK